MCVHVSDGQHWVSRNGSLMRTSNRDPRTGGVTAEVVHATDEKFPAGTVVTYRSFMGHVLCHGEGNDSCDLHPLDAEAYINDVGGPIATFLGHGYWTHLAWRKETKRRRQDQAAMEAARVERERVKQAYDAIAADFLARPPQRMPESLWPKAPEYPALCYTRATIDGIGWPPAVKLDADERSRLTVYTVSA